MRVAILSEGKTDAAVVRLLVDAVLGIETQPVPELVPIHAGWPAVLESLASALANLMGRNDCDGLVVSFDLDGSIVYPDEGDPYLKFLRRRDVKQIIDAHTADCANAGTQPVRIAVAAALPALEAWLLAGTKLAQDEAHYLAIEPDERTRQQRAALKRQKYGTTDPVGPKAIRAALANAERLAADLSILRTHFPIGFGCLEADLRSWPAT